jgi:hypothetical protein
MAMPSHFEKAGGPACLFDAVATSARAASDRHPWGGWPRRRADVGQIESRLTLSIATYLRPFENAAHPQSHNDNHRSGSKAGWPRATA